MRLGCVALLYSACLNLCVAETACHSGGEVLLWAFSESPPHAVLQDHSGEWREIAFDQKAGNYRLVSVTTDRVIIKQIGCPGELWFETKIGPPFAGREMKILPMEAMDGSAQQQ